MQPYSRNATARNRREAKMESDQDKGRDLAQGIAAAELPEGGTILGHIGDERMVLARSGGQVFAIGAACTHYSGPLAEGLVVDGTVRCPWHHACFDLATGEAVRAPALTPIASWAVREHNGRIIIEARKPEAKARAQGIGSPAGIDQIVIIGGGAAGFAAAEMLRREGYAGRLSIISNDDAAPCDRPNLSKDYLAGKAPEDWLPLRPDDFYADNGIELRLGTEASAIDARAREIALADGSRLRYDRLLLATGAEPVRLTIPGADQPHVHTLRSLRDCRAIIAAAESARHAVVMGASFIGLEVAASLRARDIEVHVVAPEHRPMERVLGPQLGDFVRALHEDHGVVFHLGHTASAIDGRTVTLEGGNTLEADLVVAGIGVRPRLGLAQAAGLTLDRGLAVDEFLETSAPGIFAAGDIARWPDRHSGERIRVEHWVVAERQGQAAARNMLGARQPFADVPFFWSQHYDVPINYVGHAQEWDALEIDGDIAGKDCLVRYMRKGRTLAVASIYRDTASLEAELSMERQSAA
jgi:apoptosis-inducing factor 3